MTRLKLNVGSMNIFNAISKNIHCFRLKYGFKISNEIQYLELQASEYHFLVAEKIIQREKLFNNRMKIQGIV